MNEFCDLAEGVGGTSYRLSKLEKLTITDGLRNVIPPRTPVLSESSFVTRLTDRYPFGSARGRTGRVARVGETYEDSGCGRAVERVIRGPVRVPSIRTAGEGRLCTVRARVEVRKQGLERGRTLKEEVV